MLRFSLLVFSGAVLIAQPPPALHSPEVLPDRRVTFRLAAPDAHEVKVSGEFLKQPAAMEKGEKGIWSVTVGPVKPDIYTYTFTVDGVRTVDPVNPKVKSGSLPNTASVIEIPGDGLAFYDLHPVKHGTVQVRWYQSKSLDRARRVHIYTPPDYDKSTARYPVLYLIHGAGGDDATWITEGHADAIVDNLIADGKAKPLVIVMPDAYAIPPMSAAAAAPGAQLTQVSGLTRDVVEDLIPFVDTNYRVYGDRDHRAIAGLSLGGGRALTIGLSHVELFSRVLGFSPALANGVSATVFPDVVSNPKKLNDGLKLLWVGVGVDDTLFKIDRSFYDFLGQNGVKATWHESEGAHTWQVWRRYLNEMTPLLW